MQTVSKAWMDNAVRTVRPEMFVEITLKAKDQDIVFTKEQITRYKQRQIGYLISESVPKNEINFSVINLDGSWDPQAPGSVEGLLEEQLPIIVRYGMMVGGSVEWIPAGTFYLTDWSTSADSHEATFIARDVMGEWLDREFDGYLGTEGTVTQFVNSTIEKAGLTAGVVVPDKYCTYAQVTNAGVLQNKLAATFQIIANASGCALQIARDGKVYFKRFPVSLSTVNTIPASEEYANPVVDRKPDARKAVLTDIVGATDVVLSENKKGRIIKAKSDIIGKKDSPGTRTFDFDVSGNLVSSAKNDIYADPRLFAQPATGSGYYRYYLNAIGLSNMARFLGPAQTVSVSYRANPVLDIFDVVLVETKYGSAQVVITELEYNFNGAFTGNLKGVVLKEVTTPEPGQEPVLGKFVLGTDKLGG